MRLDCNFSNIIFSGRAHKKCHLKNKAIILKFERQVVQRSYNDTVLRLQFPKKSIMLSFLIDGHIFIHSIWVEQLNDTTLFHLASLPSSTFALISTFEEYSKGCDDMA